jgi:hypothetical protein
VGSIKLDLRGREDKMLWIGSVWLRIGTSWGFLWTFGFHKTLGSSWVGVQLAGSQEGLSSVSEWCIITIYFASYSGGAVSEFRSGDRKFDWRSPWRALVSQGKKLRTGYDRPFPHFTQAIDYFLPAILL